MVCHYILYSMQSMANLHIQAAKQAAKEAEIKSEPADGDH